MEPTSNPDNSRPPRGLSRFWPVHRDGDDPAAEAERPDVPVARPGETQMVALGSRRAPEPAAPIGGLAPGGAFPPGLVHGTPVPAPPTFPSTPGGAMVMPWIAW